MNHVAGKLRQLGIVLSKGRNWTSLISISYEIIQWLSFLQLLYLGCAVIGVLYTSVNGCTVYGVLGKPLTIAGLFACGQMSLNFPNGEVGICAFTKKTLDKITVDCFILIKNI